MTPAYVNQIASLAVSRAASTRQSYGTGVIIASRTLCMITRPLQMREGDLIPEGAVNAAAADIRLFNASPADFTVNGVLMPPLPESVLLWAGNSYTVIFSVLADAVSGLYVSLKIFAYRTPAEGNATAAENVQDSKWPAPPT